MSKPYTLITGASKGIGKAIAIEAANRGMNLYLVARSKHLLDDLKTQLSSKGIQIEILALDLFKDEAYLKIFEHAQQTGIEINMLVNNAGMGFMGNFDETDLQKHVEVMKLNMDACVKILHQFLKTSNPNQRRYILNTVSTGAYQPVPKMAVYSASKSFMLSFSRAIRQELKKKNVYVTALCPGGTETDFFGPAKMEDVIKKNAVFMMSADKVAKVGLDAVLKNKSVAVPGIVNKLSAVASKLIPHDLVVPVAGTFFET